MVTTRLLVLSALFVAAPFAAFASGGATVGVKIAELRIKPDDQAFSRLKIPGGREVALLGKSDDGRWVKVRAELEKGEDIIKLEGWVEATQLKGGDIASLSVAGKAAPASGMTEESAFGETTSPDSSSEWGESPASAPAAASSTEAWDAAPAKESEPAAEPSMGSWDLGDTNSSGSSDSEAAPAPAEGGDSWESTDSGSSDSGSSSESTDGW